MPKKGHILGRRGVGTGPIREGDAGEGAGRRNKIPSPKILFLLQSLLKTWFPHLRLSRGQVVKRPGGHFP